MQKRTLRGTECEVSGSTRRGNSSSNQFLVAFLERHMEVAESSLGEDTEPHEKDAVLLAVADGVAGESVDTDSPTLAVRGLQRAVQEQMVWTMESGSDGADEFLESLRHAFESCDKDIRGHRADSTTLTAAAVFWPHLLVGHVGDSRCYLIREGSVLQLTTDHTVAQEFVEKGILTPTEARESHLQGVLWNVLGENSLRVKPEVAQYELKPGDTIVLCTDGVCDELPPETLSEIFSTSDGTDQACRRVIDLSAEGEPSCSARTVVMAHFPAKAAVRTPLNRPHTLRGAKRLPHPRTGNRVGTADHDRVTRVLEQRPSGDRQHTVADPPRRKELSRVK